MSSTATSGPRFAIISHSLPPSPYGQPRALQRILADVEPSRYGLLSTTPYDRDRSGAQSEAPWLDGEYIALDSGLDRHGEIGTPGVRHAFANLALTAQLLRALGRRKRSLRNTLIDGSFDVVIACSGDPIDLPAAAQVCSDLRVPLIVWLFDDYLEQWRFSPPQGWIARLFEPIVLQRARAVIVPNEFLEREYARRYEISSAIIRNPYAGCGPRAPEVQQLRGDGPINVVFTGSVYHVNLDSFQRLASATSAMDCALNVYTGVPKEYLETLGLNERFLIHEPVSDSEAQRIQGEADILFLALGFDTKVPSVVRTSAPGKLADYLVSGRPILAHAPADSFISWFCRKHDCALVVDQPDETLLAAAVRRLSTDAALRARLVRAARALAAEQFSPESGRRKLLCMIDETSKAR
jgi:glycosyltransferase involved in cell wall biosynthesis